MCVCYSRPPRTLCAELGQWVNEGVRMEREKRLSSYSIREIREMAKDWVMPETDHAG